MKNVIFPVIKVPIEDLGIKGYHARSGITHAVVVKKDQLVNFCSEDYYLRTNESVIRQISEALTKAGLTFEVKGVNFRNVRFKIEFILKTTEFDLAAYGINDPIAMTIRIMNSYDGSQRYHGSVGVLRLVCTNGLATEKELAKILLSHTPQLTDDLDIDKLLANIDTVAHDMEGMSEAYFDLMDNKVRDMGSYLLDLVDELELPKAIGEMAVERAAIEMGEYGYPSTDWIAYNSINYALNHGNDSLIGRKAENFDQRVFNHLLGV